MASPEPRRSRLPGSGTGPRAAPGERAESAVTPPPDAVAVISPGEETTPCAIPGRIAEIEVVSVTSAFPVLGELEPDAPFTTMLSEFVKLFTAPAVGNPDGAMTWSAPTSE